MLLGMAAAGGLGASGALGRLFGGRGVAQASAAERRNLIVIGATGGASIIDMAMAVSQTEAGAAYNNINAFPDAQLNQVGPFRAVNLNGSGLNLLGMPINTDQTAFVTKHQSRMLVATLSSTSVNHIIAERRSVNGNNAWNGRTLQEAVAYQYGGDCPIPNANMGAMGFLDPGVDTSLPAFAGPEAITSPLTFALGLDSSRGIKQAPSADVVRLAAAKRDLELDPGSVFFKTFRKSPRLQRWLTQRQISREQLQTLDLITKLNFLPDAPPTLPLVEYGLEQSPDGQMVLNSFPGVLVDPLEARAALTFLLIKYGVSTSVTIAPGFNPLILPGSPLDIRIPPLAFDNSHSSHRQTQAHMWGRVMGLIDSLYDLLASSETEPGSGISLWDRTTIVVATDFGRSKNRNNGSAQFGSGHDLNNGVLMLGETLQPGVLGGVDPTTAMTFGWNPSTGAPTPGQNTEEATIYAGLLQAMQVDMTDSGLPDVPAMRK